MSNAASGPELTADSESQSHLVQPDTDRSSHSVQRRTPTIPQKQYGSTHSGSTTPRIYGSPERVRRNSSSGLLISVPEHSGMDFERQTDAAHRPAFYAGGANLNGDDDDEDEAEVEEWLIEEELAKEGLYRGSYRRILALYAFTPLSTFLTFVGLAYFPILFYPLAQDSPHSSYPYSPYLPYPFPEVVTATALWSFCQFLKESVSTFSASLPDNNNFGAFVVPLITTLSQTLVSIFLKLASIVLLLIASTTEYHHPTWHDHAFRRVWAIALGWAGIEAIVGIKQGYEHIALYRDVLVTVRRISSPDVNVQTVPWTLSRETRNISMTHTSSAGGNAGKLDDEDYDEDEDDDDDLTPRVAPGERQPLLPPPANHGETSRVSKDAIAQEVENDLEQLMALKNREELEEIYGMPVIYIPVFISCLHRINAALLSLGDFLLISGAYLRSSFVPPPFHRPTPSNPPLHQPPMFGLSDFPATLQVRLSDHSNSLFALTLFGVTLAHLILAVLHSSWILPRIGIHTFVYVNCLISLGVFFAGLGYWEALV